MGVDVCPYGAVQFFGMRRVRRMGAEEARNQLPDLLKAAEHGNTTIITKHGRPVAALVPIEQLEAGASQRSLLPLKGTGRGLWGRNSSQTIRALRDEWNR
jgi:prevent-host-death family protein